MTPEQEALLELARLLERIGIPYMVSVRQSGPPVVAARDGGSDKQIEDAAGVLSLNPGIDRA